jgi:VanZ family protein
VTSARSWRAAAALWAFAIFVSGMVPTETTVTRLSGGHNAAFTTAAHLAVYAVLGFLVGVAVAGWEPRWGTASLALALAAALGGVIEVIQGPLPYRDAQVTDFVVDVIGAVLGLLVLKTVAWRRRSRSHPG